MKKKILFVIESLHLGGSEKSLISLLNNLDPNKYEIELQLLVDGGIFRDMVPNFVSVKSIPHKSFNLIQRSIYWFLKKISIKPDSNLYWQIFNKNFYRTNKEFDVAIGYSQGFATYYVAEKINSSKKIAWLNTDYRMAGHDILLDRKFYKKIGNLVIVSAEATSNFKNEAKKVSLKLDIYTIKDISDPKMVRQQSQLPAKYSIKGEIKLLTVGRLAESKGMDIAIGACKLLVEAGFPVCWYVVGEGEERPKLEKLISENRLNDYFFLLGADANPYPYMKACDIYVQTSLYEGLGLTLIEASYLNKPIVSTNFPTAYRILEDGTTGLISEKNPKSIAEKIIKLIKDPELKNSLTDKLSKMEYKDKETTLQQIEKLFDF